MKQYKCTGFSTMAKAIFYKLTVRCNGWLQAFFLITAEAIRSGKHYQLHSIQDEDRRFRWVDDIKNCMDLLTAVESSNE